jgi:hypothetical protein
MAVVGRWDSGGVACVAVEEVVAGRHAWSPVGISLFGGGVTVGERGHYWMPVGTSLSGG